MPRKKLTKAQGDRLLAETKQRQRLLQEARTSERLEQLEIEACEELGRQLRFEACEELGRQLRFEYLELSGELECQETYTRRQYTISTSDDEKDLVQEPKDGSDKKYTELESPD
jgi:hypothetical protein